MLFRKPPIWNVQPGLVAPPWREHWRAAKAVFPFWEADGSSIHPAPGFTPRGLNNGAVRRLTRYGPSVYFPRSSGNEVETADDNPITFVSGEPYTLALLILSKESPGTEGIFRSGSSSTGNNNWLWMLSSGKLWGRHADVNSPSSGSGHHRRLAYARPGSGTGSRGGRTSTARLNPGQSCHALPTPDRALSVAGKGLARGGHQPPARGVPVRTKLRSTSQNSSVAAKRGRCPLFSNA